MRVLHADCGDGESTRSLTTFVPMGEVIGIDPDSSRLRLARSSSYVADAGEVSFERGSLNGLPYATSEFDAVLVDSALATGGSPERALEEAKRVLAPGGLLGVRHTVASSRIITGKVPLLERALTRRDSVLRDLGGDPDIGLRQPSLLRDAGFVNMRVSSSTEQKSDEELLTELTAGGFVPHVAEADLPDEDAGVEFSFVTVIETVCWKPA